MKRTISTGIVKRLAFYACAFVLMVAVWRFEVYLQSGPLIYQNIPIQSAAVDTFMGMNRLLITLGTSLLGAMGLLLSTGFRGKSCLKELWAVMAGGVCIGVSIYYGYVANMAVMSMVASGSFNPYSPLLMRTHNVHFVTFVLGVIFFAGFIFQNMTTEGEHEQPHNATGS
jgi:hypothetical protein